MEGWADEGSVWAKVEPLGAREQFAAKQIIPDAAYRVWVRYRSDVTGTWRATWRGKALNFTPPVEWGRKVWLEIVVSVGTL